MSLPVLAVSAVLPESGKTGSSVAKMLIRRRPLSNDGDDGMMGWLVE